MEKTLGRHCKQRLSIKEFSLIHCLVISNHFLLLIVGLTMWLGVMSKSCPRSLFQDTVSAINITIMKGINYLKVFWLQNP